MPPRGDLVYGMGNEGLLRRSFLKVSRRKISWGIPLLLCIRDAPGDPFPRKRLLAAGPAWIVPSFSGLVCMLSLTGYTEKAAHRIMGLPFQVEGAGGSGTQHCESVVYRLTGCFSILKHLFLKTQGLEFTSPEPI